MSSDRAAAPALGTVMLLAVVVIAASALAVAAADAEPGSTPPTAVLEASADDSGTIAITHVGGDPLNPDTLRLRVSVDGEPLARQPPLPFFAARGFGSGPTGAFNGATAGEWRAGETSTFRIARTNDPTPSPGATVRLRLYAGEYKVADLTATV